MTEPRRSRNCSMCDRVSLGDAGDDQEMCAQPEERWFRLHGFGGEQDDRSALFRGPMGREVRQPAREALHTEKLPDRQPRLFCLSSQLGRMMEERRGEPVRSVLRIAMLAISKISLDDLSEVAVEEEPPGKAIEQRRETTDAGARDNATGADDSSGFAEGVDTIGSVREVVQRTEDKRDVKAVVRK